jgi:hypothetical protein
MKYFLSILVFAAFLVLTNSSTNAQIRDEAPSTRQVAQRTSKSSEVSPMPAGLTAGNVLKLNGTNNYVQVYPNSSLNLQAPLSIELWAYMEDWSAGGPARTGVMSKLEQGSGGFEIGLDLGYSAKTIGVQFLNCGTTNPLAQRSRTTLASGWHLFTGTFDGRYLRFYTDGVLSATADAGSVCSLSYPYSFELRFGRSAMDSGYGNNYFKGRIDEARIYNKVLTAAEILAHYNNGDGTVGQPEANLVAGWHFDEADGSRANDYSGANRFGTLMFGGLWLPRSIAPNTIAGIDVPSLGETTATIDWVTQLQSNSVIEYGTTTSYGSTATSATMVSDHSLSLSGLNPYTVYHYRLKSTQNGQTAISTDRTFTTLDRRPVDNQFYVAPNASPWGNGSAGSPWSLATALASSQLVQPGATIWLRGGVYNVPSVDGGFTSTLTGTAAAPIKVRGFPGEWAVIDGNRFDAPIKDKTVLTIQGAYTWFMGFEITNSDPNGRKIDTTGSNGPERRGNSIDDYAVGTRIINLVIHDTGQGIGGWQQGHDNEYYGNLIYNNGWDAPDRLHGHGVYTQNDVGYKRLIDNILINPFGANARTGGTDVSSVRNYTWQGNSFINGYNEWLGPRIENLQVFENFTFNNIFKVGNEVNPTYRNAEVAGNYFTTGVELFEFVNGLSFHHNTVWNTNDTGKDISISTSAANPASNIQMSQNTYYQSFRSWPYWHLRVASVGNPSPDPRYFGDFAVNRTQGTQAQTYAYTGKSWQDDLHLDVDSLYVDDIPRGQQVFIRPNAYDPGRATIYVYNWDNAPAVAVSLGRFLRNGDRYELHNVQDYFNDVIVGIYRGKSITIPMQGRTQARPIGYDQVTSWYHDPLRPNTFPRFGAFILVKK